VKRGLDPAGRLGGGHREPAQQLTQILLVAAREALPALLHGTAVPPVRLLDRPAAEPAEREPSWQERQQGILEILEHQVDLLELERLRPANRRRRRGFHPRRRERQQLGGHSPYRLRPLGGGSGDLVAQALVVRVKALRFAGEEGVDEACRGSVGRRFEVLPDGAA